MRPWTRIRGDLAAAIHWDHPPETIAALRRDLRAARAETYLRELVTAEPAITEAQRAELAAVLIGGTAEH